MSDFWRHVRLAFTSRGPYDPTGRDQEIARLREVERRSLVLALPGQAPDDGTDDNRHMRYTIALVRAHQRIYGTWPPAERVERALDAMHVPHSGSVLDDATCTAVPLIYRSTREKGRLMADDPDRYFTVVRAQRNAEVRGLPIPADDDVPRGEAS